MARTMGSDGSPFVANVATFWRSRLEGLEGPTPLAIDRKAGSGAEPESLDVALSDAEAELLEAFLRRTTVGHGTFFAAIWAVILSRYADRDEVLFGLAEGKHRLLPRRVHLSKEPVIGWLGALEKQFAEEDAQEPSGLDQIRSWLGWGPDQPLIKSAVLINSASTPELPLVLRVDCPELFLSLVFDPGRVERQAAERMSTHVSTLIRGILRHEQGDATDLPILPDAERHQLLFEFNDTRHDFPRDRCFHHLVEDRAAEFPEAPALVFGNQQLSYGELNRRSNQLANFLVGLGVGPDVRVGLFIDRSIEMVVGILGILKAGGAFTPLDPNYPRERLAFMMSDAKAPVLLSQESLVEDFSESTTRCVCLDRDWPEIAREPSENPAVPMHSDHLAYVIYTSGSTGRPKGVAIRHRGSLNNVYDLNTRFGVGAADRMIAISSLSFDMCVYEVLGTLMSGGTLIMPQPSRSLDPAHWAQLVHDHGVTVWNSAPQLLHMLLDHVEERPGLHPHSLRLAILGGDWVPLTLPDRFKALTAPGSRVVVLGGATECSIHSTFFEVETVDPEWKSIPYGRPQWNQSCYVLDSQRRLCPIGIPGELHLGGEGLGRGYLDRPELTKGRFVDHPFSEVPGDRLYKTGDLVRLDETGLLELLGRLDFMVKIRGFRVEPGEVEAVIRSHPAVEDAVALVRDDEPNERYLVAYVVPRDSAMPTSEAERMAKAQVERWREIYETTYGTNDGSHQDPTFNIAGWNSSYTGDPLPAAEMRIWVDTTVDRIHALKPRRVLEIGCGTGLLLFRLAPYCDRYVGTDFSGAALEHIDEQVTPLGMEQVETELREAIDFRGFEDGSFDVVVLNSIVLQFPDLEYVLEVLKGASRVVRPGGAVFVGDVRNLATMETYHTSVEVFRAVGTLPCSELRERIRQRMLQEEELLIDPDFFRALASEIPRFSSCVVQPKRGRYMNELSKYRYDATLFVEDPGSQTLPQRKTLELDWRGEGLTFDELLDVFASAEEERILVRRVPNVRLAADNQLLALVNSDACPETAAEVRARVMLGDQSQVAMEPDDFCDLHASHGYAADAQLSEGSVDGSFDVLLERIDANDTRDGRLILPPRRAPRPLAELINHPMRNQVERQVVAELRSHVSRHLPAHMVPTAFVTLDRLPLTPNGKVDRGALPSPDPSLMVGRRGLASPRNPVQTLVALIWAEVLGVAEVGTGESFFELGGHSLKATQIITRIQDTLHIHVPLDGFLRCRTVASLSELIEEIGVEAGVEVMQVADIVLEVEALSDAEVSELLERQTPESERQHP